MPTTRQAHREGLRPFRWLGPQVIRVLQDSPPNDGPLCHDSLMTVRRKWMVVAALVGSIVLLGAVSLFALATHGVPTWAQTNTGPWLVYAAALAFAGVLTTSVVQGVIASIGHQQAASLAEKQHSATKQLEMSKWAREKRYGALLELDAQMEDASRAIPLYLPQPLNFSYPNELDQAVGNVRMTLPASDLSMKFVETTRELWVCHNEDDSLGFVKHLTDIRKLAEWAFDDLMERPRREFPNVPW